MRQLTPSFLGDLAPCSYLPEQESRFENFLALDVSASEIDALLAVGWRKFGPHFFRPRCPQCSACLPLRVLTREFSPNKEQRRIQRKSQSINSHFGELSYRPEFFTLYQKHSQLKFGSIPIQSEAEFLEAFFLASAPALLHTLTFNDQLIGLGFLDQGEEALSSVYFCYDPDWRGPALGTLSVVREIEYANRHQLPYYYLGYFIAQNAHMNYKARFSPFELFDWYTRSWKRS